MQQLAAFIVFLLSLTTALLWALPCAGQAIDEPEPPNAAQLAAAKQFQAHAKAVAAAYDVRADSISGRKLALSAEPILRWTNPVPERQMHGEVFLWTDQGRPAAVLCLFEMTEGGAVRECHEFCSLAKGALAATAPSKFEWSPTEAQLSMSPLPDAPPPAKSARQRLRQMRELATRFACEKTTRMGDKHTLRLLSQPVARYESPLHDVSDGALFTFVEATDPEAFLLLEARPVGGISQWHFGFARMVSVQVQATLAGNAVWEVEQLPYDGYRNRPDRPYALLFPR